MTIQCPYCARQFEAERSLRSHMRSKRRTSAAHGLTEDRFPRSSKMIADGIEQAIYETFGVELPPDNSRPIPEDRR